eukprot:scaffold150130_cov18-Tisochrysis_lutea.AAC.2
MEAIFHQNVTSVSSDVLVSGSFLRRLSTKMCGGFHRDAGVAVDKSAPVCICGGDGLRMSAVAASSKERDVCVVSRMRPEDVFANVFGNGKLYMDSGQNEHDSGKMYMEKCTWTLSFRCPPTAAPLHRTHVPPFAQHACAAHVAPHTLPQYIVPTFVPHGNLFSMTVPVLAAGGDRGHIPCACRPATHRDVPYAEPHSACFVFDTLSLMLSWKSSVAVKVCSRTERLGFSACHVSERPLLNGYHDVANTVHSPQTLPSLCSAAAKKREMDDNSKKIGQLLWRLNAGEVSEGVIPKLMQLCMAIDAADWHTANHIQAEGSLFLPHPSSNETRLLLTSFSSERLVFEVANKQSSLQNGARAVLLECSFVGEPGIKTAQRYSLRALQIHTGRAANISAGCPLQGFGAL